MGSVELIVDELLESNPSLKLNKIRIDDETKMGSVIDVIKMVIGASSDYASTVFNRLPADLLSKIVYLKINKKGKDTPVADAPTLVEIIWALPGKSAREFRRQSAHYICRVLAGDVSLAVEIEERFKSTPTSTSEFLMANVERPVMSPVAEAEVVRRTLELQTMVIDGQPYTMPNQDMSLEMKQILQQEIEGALTRRRDLLERDHLHKKARIIESTMDLTTKMHPSLQIALNDRISSLIMESAIGTEILKIEAPKWLPEFSSLMESIHMKYDNTRLTKIGKLVSKEFKQRFPDQEIQKVEKHVNGAIRLVNVYEDIHRDWIMEIIRTSN
jgi:hypothetical protein